MQLADEIYEGLQNSISNKAASLPPKPSRKMPSSPNYARSLRSKAFAKRRPTVEEAPSQSTIEMLAPLTHSAVESDAVAGEAHRDRSTFTKHKSHNVSPTNLQRFERHVVEDHNRHKSDSVGKVERGVAAKISQPVAIKI